MYTDKDPDFQINFWQGWGDKLIKIKHLGTKEETDISSNLPFLQFRINRVKKKMSKRALIIQRSQLRSL
jgi:hypothetical protein